MFLYNGNNIVVPAEELVIVEGFAGVWWLVQNEFDNTVGLMSATCSTEQIELIVGMVPRRGRIWGMTDGDQAGQYCAESLLRQLAPYRMVRWLELKNGRKPQHCTADELRDMFF